MIAHLEDSLVKQKQEFEGFKKRIERDKDEHKKYAIESIFKELIELADNLERAIGSSQSSTNFQAMIQGLLMIHSHSEW